MIRSASLRPKWPPGELHALQKRLFIFGRRKPRSRVAAFARTTAGVLFGAAFLVYASDSRAGVHEWLVVPALHAWTKDDPERGHELAIAALKSGLSPKDKTTDDPALALKIWGRHMSNPIGLAAGFDKHAEAVDGLLDLGFGYVEIGSVTPVSQDGNPKPRVFRIPSTSSIVNRYGFNSEGSLVVLARLRERVVRFFHSHADLLPSTIFPIHQPGETIDPFPVSRLLSSPIGAAAGLADEVDMPRSLRPGQLLAVNLGKNKISPPESIDDFVSGVQKLGSYADVLVVNVSSPNTPGLRGLQQAGMIDELLEAVVKARDALPSKVKPPVLLKIAPDLSGDQLDDIAQAALESKIDGIIVSNTTTSRPPSAGTDTHLVEAGGLSGPPLKALSLPVLTSLYRTTQGRIPLIGCGGVSTSQDAIDYARAGASFVQLYTSFTYGGVGLPRKLKDQVTAELHKQGTTWQQLIGSGVEPATEQQLKEERAIRRTRAEAQKHEAFLRDLAAAKADLAAIVKAIQTEETRAILQSNGMPVLVEETPTAAPTAVASQSTLPSATANTGDATPSKTAAAGEWAGGEPKVQGKVSVPLASLFSTWGLRKDAPTSGKKLV